MFDHGHRARLNSRALPHFSGETLFDSVARVVCEADCLPRKELYESWEVARRARRRFRGGRIVDLACGHGLIAHLMLILDDTSKAAIAIDRKLPASAARLSAALLRAWPRISERITYEEKAIEEITVMSSDVVVSAHACGSLTDRVIEKAAAARARVVVLPCCHDESTCDTGRLEGWMDAALAIDATRAARLAARGYAVHTQHIPAAITPKNRLLLGDPMPLQTNGEASS
ncbi:MAG: methyltransferase [Polyangiaceae bacterium]